jgi:hypothetical protein
LDDQQILEESDRNGRIIVKLHRGRFAKQKGAQATEPQSFYPDSEYVDLKTSCEEVVHKHQVSHVMK